MSSDQTQTSADVRDISATLLRCMAAAMACPVGNRIWPIDEAGRMTFLKIPQSVSHNHAEAITQTNLATGRPAQRETTDRFLRRHLKHSESPTRAPRHHP